MLNHLVERAHAHAGKATLHQLGQAFRKGRFHALSTPVYLDRGQYYCPWDLIYAYEYLQIIKKINGDLLLLF